jgi:p-hydroxybenzoate 3-monooxygenase
MTAYQIEGGDLRLQTTVTAVRDGARAAEVDVVDAGGRTSTLTCRLVAGCDGRRGPTRRALLAGPLREIRQDYPYRWLTVLAAAPPSAGHIIYAPHEDGFAGHMPRTPTVTRFYVQCAMDDTERDWPDDRIWAELDRRLAVDGWRLTRGPVLERSMLEMSGAVCDAMHHGRLVLAGDAAHIITPAGGKGMNLAIGDAHLLARTIADDGGAPDALARYSAARLAHAWQTQLFSDWLLRLISTPPAADPGAAFRRRLALAYLERLAADETTARGFADSYLGLR